MLRHPDLWVYLLGAITILIIRLRRVVRLQTPLNDELYSKQVAIENVQSGVAWVRADGNVGSVNQALADTVGRSSKELLGTAWRALFPEAEREKLEEVYREALLRGKGSLETTAERPDGSRTRVSVLLVSVHDHKSRLIGHYCLMQDRSREVELEKQVRGLEQLERSPATAR
jgi:PAS domain S-box-containing protein